MKKFLSIFASLTLATGILAACGTSGSDEGSKGGGAAEGPVTIKLHTHGTEDGYAWKKTIDAFEKEHENIKVEVVQLSEKQDSQEALQKIDLAAASGEQMDVIMVTNLPDFAQRVELEMFEPLDEFIEKEGFSYDDEYKVNYSIDGKHYGFPGKYTSWYVLMNKDHLDAAGLEVPESWTWEEFMDYAKKLTTDDHYGTYFHGPQAGAWIDYMQLRMKSQAEGVDFLKADGTSNLDDPMFAKSLEMRLKMEKEDKSAVPYSTMISQKMNYRDQFFTQAASMIITGTWMNPELGGSDRFPVDFNVTVAPIPQNSADQDGAYTAIGGDIVGIASSSKHKEAAYEFIRWYSTEGQLAQGINIPAWKAVSDEQLEALVDGILAEAASPEKVDKQALLHAIQTAKAPTLGKAVPYALEINQELSNEFEKLILDKQDLDTTVENSKKIVQDIIDKNK
ncbi:sugar ABC transporter substrate-binding protein [Bacillus sp. FJAT-50079]|uniref:ABC transporter substrate-binding protein n=1 Tax=Bacillus sp. FJAT-50079 TaxID=2833577 RepID=UPI001BC8CFCC|nr:sugar ABC transporter substrate-binding protein [Bacillus sp. FJAT-50079]MBS4210169.1 sugar ABC transporter substrate-binding protein [Bacillus sp. FJAT-50079]